MKRHYIKIGLCISIILMIGFFHRNEVHAIAKNDCGAITGTTSLLQKHTIGDTMINFEEMFPSETLERAIIHLNTYCCNQWLLDKESEPCKEYLKLNGKDKGPQSPFLFDHLIDVGLRRLDGINNYNLESDPMSQERRSALSGIMNNPNGVIASSIIKTYTAYRTLHSDFMFKKTHLNIQNFDANQVGNLEEFLSASGYNNTGTVSLADKYNNICFIARNLYEKKPGEKSKLIGTDKLTKGRSYYTDCQKMVAQRVRKENTLVKTVIIEQSNRILMENVNQVINKHFVQDKLSKLQTTIINIRDLFSTFVTQAAASKQCSN